MPHSYCWRLGHVFLTSMNYNIIGQDCLWSLASYFFWNLPLLTQDLLRPTRVCPIYWKPYHFVGTNFTQNCSLLTNQQYEFVFSIVLTTHTICCFNSFKFICRLYSHSFSLQLLFHSFLNFELP
jgi:hypothetical protein